MKRKSNVKRNGVPLSQLPHFIVEQVHKNHGANSEPTLEGHFSGAIWPYEDKSNSWLHMIYKERRVLSGRLLKSSGPRILIELKNEDVPYLIGESLACLPPLFVTQRAMLVVDPRCVWEKTRFVAAEGRDLSRNQTPKEIPGTWDHDHCPFCGIRIDHAEEAWWNEQYRYYVCFKCYAAYVEQKLIPATLPTT